MKAFQEHRPDDIIKQAGSAYFPAKVEKRTPGAMNLEEFKATVAQVLKTNEYEEYLEKLFTKVSFIIMFDKGTKHFDQVPTKFIYLTVNLFDVIYLLY